MQVLLLSTAALWLGILSDSVVPPLIVLATIVVLGRLHIVSWSWSAVATFLVIGAVWSDVRTQTSDTIVDFPYGPVTVTGWVSDLPVRKNDTYRTRLTLLNANDTTFHGDVLVDLPAIRPPRYGEVLRVSARFQEAPVFNDFDYRAYLSRQGIGAVAYGATAEPTGDVAGNPLIRVVYDVRARLEASLLRSIPEPAASLAVGLVVGGQTGLSNADQEAFRRSGMTHLLAVSGYNMSLIAGAVVAILLNIIGRRPATLVSVAVVMTYAVIAGATPSALRAAAMVSAAAIAFLLGRERQVLGILSIAVMPLLLWEPWLVHDIGFQLSVAATVGLIELSPRFEVLFSRFPSWLREGLATSLSAIIATLPITATTFHSVSLVALFANVVSAPFVTASTLTSIFTALFGLVVPELGQMAGLFAWATILPIHATAQFFAAFPNSYVFIGDVPTPFAFALVALGTAAHRWHRIIFTAVQQYRLIILPAGVSVLAIALVGFNWQNQPKTTIAYLPTGDASLVTTSTGNTILVLGDAGDGLNAKLGDHLSFWNRSIDLIVVKDWAQATAIADIVRRNRIGLVIGPKSDKSERYEDLLVGRGIAIELIDDVRAYRIGDVMLTSRNVDSALAVRLELPQFRASWNDNSPSTVAQVTDVENIPSAKILVSPTSLSAPGKTIYQQGRDSTVLVTVHPDKAEISVVRPMRSLW